MGVPKFFRYISERYPCLSELARDQCIPEFDNLYLDMNGIIHNCTHSDNAKFGFNISEEEMFKNIFNYVDKLFFLIKPQKLFFMAVDGVAPRAKMNQQRSRRFRSAKEAEMFEQQAEKRGVEQPLNRFDSNCITPGTEFMASLHEALMYFIKSKISTDHLWQKCRVILSGQDCPGEGEHKIMDYIRYLKSQPNFDPNTRHCLYGLDADLIILGLCTHELHFVILREEVKFSKEKRTSIEETRFYLLHLGLLREYLELEFDGLRQIDPDFDIARLIDDWVLMGFLVGNDFIPHLPCLHISSNALPLLYKTYIEVYPKLGGNINVNGNLNLERLEKYFHALSKVELEIFEDHYADLAYFNSKITQNGVEEAFDFETSDITNNSTDDDLAVLIENSRMFLEMNEIDDNAATEAETIMEEFQNFRRSYYINKLKHEDMTKEARNDQAICYIRALQWILDYYYRGVQSWDWYYPHHYAPFICDLTDFSDFKIEFNMGKPFLPFQQLLAVLPAASKALLPAAYRDLMTNPSSEVVHFYPENFEVDLNGKKHEWEAVVLIPFIDEKLLLRAMERCNGNITPIERQRNQHGPMIIYDFCAKSQGKEPGIYSMKPIYHVFCTQNFIWSRDIVVSSEKSVCVELPNAARHVFFPGFPTMRHLPFTFKIASERVKVFDAPSRNESLILMPIKRDKMDNLDFVAEKYLDKVVFIGWPHLIKAKIVGVTDASFMVTSKGRKTCQMPKFLNYFGSIQNHTNKRMGIKFDLNVSTTVIVHVRTYIGSSYSFDGTKIVTNDSWSHLITSYPSQGIVSEIAVQDAVKKRIINVEDLYPTDSLIFFVGSPYFGSEGVILDPMRAYQCGRLQINITVLPEPNLSIAKTVQSQQEDDYKTTIEAANILGVRPKCLKIVGSILVIPGPRRTDIPEHVTKRNIGLLMKFHKFNEVRIGYMRRENKIWLYSSKAIEVIQQYYEKYPMVFRCLSTMPDRSDNTFFEEDFFPDKIGENCVEEIVQWVNSLEHMGLERISSDSKTIEKKALEKCISAVDELKNLPVKNVKLQVKPHLLLKPNVTLPIAYRPDRPIECFDRVVIVRNTYMVKVGARGTVVGVYPVVDPNPVRFECVKTVTNFFEVLFDKLLTAGNSLHGIAESRVLRVPETSLLLIPTEDAIRTSAPVENIQQTASTTSLCSVNSSKLSVDKNKTTANFWDPSTTTNANATNQLNCNSNVSLLQKPNGQLQQRQNVDTSKNQVETQALKNMLGLTKPVDEPSTSSTPSQLQKLPQPPIYWQREAQSQRQDNKTHPLNNTLPQIPPSQNKVSDDNEFIKKNNLNENSANVLMNMLNVKKPINDGTTADAATNTLEQKVNNISLGSSTEITVNEPPNNSTSTNLNQNNSTNLPKELTRRPRRRPKIGAKFDFAP